MTVTTRPARPDDAPAMADLINALIARGGTTAHQRPFDAEEMLHHYIAPPDNVSCTVALTGGAIAGFQSVVTGAGRLPEGWGEIGTFVALGMQGRGVGKALFAATRAAARATGLRWIDATIRADNDGGLAYYAGLGFRDYAILRHVPLDDGRRVDRRRKRLAV